MHIFFSICFRLVAKGLNMMPKSFEDFPKKGGGGGGVRPNWKQNATSHQLGRTFFKLALQGHMQHVPQVWALLYRYLA